MEDGGLLHFFAGATKALIACIAAIICTTVTVIGLTVVLDGSEFWRQSQGLLALAIIAAYFGIFWRALSGTPQWEAS